ncbi:hypothetical protein HELRODRAFT_180469 [Helobdella robusta]|uniref:Laminin G domain-containing protein n=1 Tax=Helobdella robusta TaxID=6412 RepID=T1FFY8_HELRO|nr:hypothetical protein HELRODRAFT_180469 [Helobdella robusta]ESN93819.1 hypothetical protein HELRODRAFT_180469 [Helobdella robusta]
MTPLKTTSALIDNSWQVIIISVSQSDLCVQLGHVKRKRKNWVKSQKREDGMNECVKMRERSFWMSLIDGWKESVIITIEVSSSVTMLGDGWITFRAYDPDIVSRSFEWLAPTFKRVSILFKTKSAEGILLHSLSSLPLVSYLAVSLFGASVHVSMLFAEKFEYDEIQDLVFTGPYDDDRWHNFTLTKIAPTAYRIHVDDVTKMMTSSSSLDHVIILPPFIHLGGIDRESGYMGLKSALNFVGCLNDVTINDYDVLTYLWSVNDDDDDLALLGEKLMLTARDKDSIVTKHSLGGKISDGFWHTIKLKLLANKIKLKLDNSTRSFIHGKTQNGGTKGSSRRQENDTMDDVIIDNINYDNKVDHTSANLCFLGSSPDDKNTVSFRGHINDVSIQGHTYDKINVVLSQSESGILLGHCEERFDWPCDESDVPYHVFEGDVTNINDGKIKGSNGNRNNEDADEIERGQDETISSSLLLPSPSSPSLSQSSSSSSSAANFSISNKTKSGTHIKQQHITQKITENLLPFTLPSKKPSTVVGIAATIFTSVIIVSILVASISIKIVLLRRKNIQRYKNLSKRIPHIPMTSAIGQDNFTYDNSSNDDEDDDNDDGDHVYLHAGFRRYNSKVLYNHLSDVIVNNINNNNNKNNNNNINKNMLPNNEELNNDTVFSRGFVQIKSARYNTTKRNNSKNNNNNININNNNNSSNKTNNDNKNIINTINNKSNLNKNHTANGSSVNWTNQRNRKNESARSAKQQKQ